MASPHKIVELQINPVSRRQLASGFGASWHSLLRSPLGHAGSPFGGTPPVLPRYENLWNSIEEAADWYRLKLIRAEFEWRQFEQTRGTFTWESPEMRILRRILRWSQNHGADVILQNMFMGGSWNVFPEFAGDPVLETYSAPADLDAFANGWVKLLRHLIDEHGFSCIRWICLINEPGKWWWHLPQTIDAGNDGLRKQSQYVAQAAGKVRCALDRAGFQHIRIMGLDESDLCNYPDLSAEPWFGSFQDVDFHCYNAIFDRDIDEFKGKWFYSLSEAAKRMRRYSASCQAQGKGFYLTEFGTMAHGYGFDSGNPASAKSVLKDTALVIEALNAGVDGLCNWSFCNRGDVDGQWQLVETWDREEKRWMEKATLVQPAAGMLGQVMRHLPHRACIHSVMPHGLPDLSVAVVSDSASPNHLTLFAVNSGPEPVGLLLRSHELEEWKSWNISSTTPGQAGTALNSQGVLNAEVSRDGLLILTNLASSSFTDTSARNIKPGLLMRPRHLLSEVLG